MSAVADGTVAGTLESPPVTSTLTVPFAGSRKNEQAWLTRGLLIRSGDGFFVYVKVAGSNVRRSMVS